MRALLVRFRMALITVAVIAAAAGYWSIGRAKAQTTRTSASGNFMFQMVGLASGETIRLNLVNMSDVTSNPSSCHAVLKFLDLDGHGVASKEVMLEPGHSTTLDLSWSTLKGTDRAEVRAHSAASSDHCRPSVEVFDDLTRRTSIHYSTPPQSEPTPFPVQ